jgi:hypothetical protein
MMKNSRSRKLHSDEKRMTKLEKSRKTRKNCKEQVNTRKMGGGMMSDGIANRGWYRNEKQRRHGPWTRCSD